MTESTEMRRQEGQKILSLHFTEVSEEQRQEMKEDRVGEGDISLQVTELQKWRGPDKGAINHPRGQRVRKQAENPVTRQELSSRKGMQSDGNKVSISNTFCLSSHCLLAELLQSHRVIK